MLATFSLLHCWTPKSAPQKYAPSHGDRFYGILSNHSKRHLDRASCFFFPTIHGRSNWSHSDRPTDRSIGYPRVEYPRALRARELKNLLTYLLPCYTTQPFDALLECLQYSLASQQNDICSRLYWRLANAFEAAPKHTYIVSKKRHWCSTL